MPAGAPAIREDEPEPAAKTIHNALENGMVSMEAYAPKGSYPEGPSYWGYGTSYNVILIGALTLRVLAQPGSVDRATRDEPGPRSH